MNTLARSTARPFLTTRPVDHDRVALGDRVSECQGARRSRAAGCIAASVCLHLAALAYFAARPTVTQAATAPVIVDLVFDDSTPHPPVAPQGVLEAPAEPDTKSTAPTTTPPVQSGRDVVANSLAPDADRAEKEVPSNAITNPYGDASFVATRGHTAGPRVASKSALPERAATFGVEQGRDDASQAARKALSAWYERVRSELARRGMRSYPARAQKLGQEGTSKITVSISESGALTGATLALSSGHALLDQAALAGLLNVGSVDPPPVQTGAMTLIVPVTFRLN